MNIKLLTYTPDAERVVAAAAKLCYAASDVDHLLSGLDAKRTEEFIEKLAALGHESPIEHASYTFAAEGVSRALLAQLTRHRIASYSVQSQRYVSKENFEYIIPPEIASVPAAAECFAEAMRNAGAAYNNLRDILRREHTSRLVAAGKSEKTAALEAEKIANEDARFALPNACDTRVIFTMNARSLRNFFRQRCCRRAQWEIREMAWEMLRILREVSPTLFRGAGPSCITGRCSEGAMSCGKPYKSLI